MGKEKSVGGSLDPLLNILLTPLALMLALVALFAMQEILLTVGARVIAATVEGSVRGAYALVALRNFWLIGGGLLLVGYVIYVLDAGFKRWRTRRYRRLLMRSLAVELLVIALAVAVVLAG